MSDLSSRRKFLRNVGRGTLTATVGLEVALELALTSNAGQTPGRLTFGALEPLVRLVQETPADALLPLLVKKWRAGTPLRDLVAAGALANARVFGGEDYVGFHTMMALAPAFHMAGQLSGEEQLLPVLKVLYRNTRRIHERGGVEVLQPVSPAESAASQNDQAFRNAVRQRDVGQAERLLAQAARVSADEAFNRVLLAVEDDTEVHRTVLPYRAWDLMGLIGTEQAETLLRQSVRYCVQAERGRPMSGECRTVLPKALEAHKLLDRSPGTRQVDDAWVEKLSNTLFNATVAEAANAAAAALAEGIDPEAVGEAIALTANQLVLRDLGRRPFEESTGKPVGSVHGDSIGVHASDSANAWRNMARVSNARNAFSCLILGAYQVAFDRTNRGGDFQNWKALPVEYHLKEIKTAEPASLLRLLDEAIRDNQQAHAVACVHRYGELGHPHEPVFQLLLRYAVSEDGALHAEKFYRTSSEEFAGARAPFRWRYAMGLARVTASEFGHPAPGLAEAKSLLKV